MEYLICYYACEVSWVNTQCKLTSKVELNRPYCIDVIVRSKPLPCISDQCCVRLTFSDNLLLRVILWTPKLRRTSVSLMAWRHMHKVYCFLNEIQGYIQARFRLIQQKEINNFKQNNENLMKIGLKIRKIWNCAVLQFFTKHFLITRYEYANEWVDGVIASQFSIQFVHRNDKNLIFLLWESKTCLISTLNKCKIMFTEIYLIWGRAFTCLSKK